MKCPECIKEGKRSIVTQGASYSTLMHIPIQYDEDGRMIQPSARNISKTSYSCSNGHQFEEDL